MADNWDDKCDSTPTAETTHINSSNMESNRGRGQGFNKLENDWQQSNGQNEDNWIQLSSNSNNNNQNDDNSKDVTDSKRKIFSFLRTKKEKPKEEKKEKKKKKKKKDDSSSSKEDGTSLETKDSNSIDLPINGPNSDTPVVDDEGYIIRPNSDNKTMSENHFYSSSDSDSEEERQQKIRIKIKPLTNGAPISASVDELIASAGTLSLSPIAPHSRRRPNALRLKSRRIFTNSTSPTPEDRPIKRSISANHNISKTENDLMTVFSPSLSSASYSSGIANENQMNSKNHSLNSNSTENSRQKTPTADRYAALIDLFAESMSESPTTLSKSMSATILSPPVLASLPRPPSKRNPQTSPQLSHQSSNTSTTMSRCKSVSSLSSDFRMTPISVSSSRGPSPLTLGISDSVPIAIALQESVSASFKGIDESKCHSQIIGSLKMAFPAGIVQAFANNPYVAPLTFKLTKSYKLEKIFPNKELITEITSENGHSMSDGSTFEVNMSALMTIIRHLCEETPNARYYKVDVLKYQTRSLQGAKSTPLQLVSYWKCEPQRTNLKIDYKYNGSALAQSQPLRNVSILVNIDGEPHFVQSHPEGKWNGSTHQALWRFDQISSKSDLGGLGSIKAKFELSSGPSTPSPILAHFSCMDSIITGVDFQLTGMGYRVSLVKKQFFSGRYVCEPSVVPKSSPSLNLSNY